MQAPPRPSMPVSKNAPIFDDLFGPPVNESSPFEVASGGNEVAEDLFGFGTT